MHNTGNPIGSKDILDLYDNSENIDYFANSQLDEHPDRFGTKRLTLAGLIKRSMALRNEINDFSGALTFKPEWSDVPMNVSEGVGGAGGALNLQAEALGNRSEINKITSREALRRVYQEAGLDLVEGSFEEGAVITSTTDVVLHEKTGKCYSGPIGVVPKDTDPTATLKYTPVPTNTPLSISVKFFGAKGDGITDDTDAIQKAINNASLLGMTVSLSGQHLCRELNIPSNFKLIGPPGTCFTTVKFNIFGNFGEEQKLALPAESGDNVIKVSDASTFRLGDTVRIISSVNSNSDDAGIFALGARTTDFSYLAEYNTITEINGNDITLGKNLIFPYPITSLPDSGSRSCSTIRKVDFISNVIFENIRINGNVAPGFRLLVEGYICKNVIFRDCYFKNLDLGQGGIDIVYGENVYLESSTVQLLPYVTDNPNANNVKFRSCQSSGLRNNCVLLGGNQQLDITYITKVDPNFGGPSIDCGSEGTRCEGAGVDGLCDHPGCYSSYFVGNFVVSNSNGIRLRSRKVRCLNNVLIGRRSVDINRAGIRIGADTVTDAIISGNIVEGFYYGCNTSISESMSASKLSNFRDGKKLFTGNIFREVNVGMYFTPGYTNLLSKSFPITVHHNHFYDVGTDGILIDPYFNGLVITNNLFSNIGTKSNFSSAINIKQGNITGLIIKNNQQFNSKEETRFITGPAVASYDKFITDLVTFPGGDTEANLTIEDNTTDAKIPFARMTLHSSCFSKKKPLSCVPVFTGISNIPLSPSLDLGILNQHTYVDETTKEIKMQLKLSDGTSKLVIIGNYT